MNFKMILFNGLMTALIGAMIGLAIATIAQREGRRQYIIVTGSVLGFVTGSFFECVRAQKNERESDDDGKENKWE